MTTQVAAMKLKYYRAGYHQRALVLRKLASASVLLKTVAAELKSPTVLGYGPSDVLGYSAVNISFNFERDLYRGSHQAH